MRTGQWSVEHCLQHWGSLYKSDIIVRFVRTNRELAPHLKAVLSVETKNLLSTFLAAPVIAYKIRQWHGSPSF